MARVRPAAPLLLVALALSGCGGGSGSSTAASSPDPTLQDATPRTTAAGTARFELTVSGKVAGVAVRSEENGSVSFARRRAHLYKLIPGGGLPQEVVVIGPLTYTNANVQAAMDDPTVKPWTRLDTRRLTAAQRRNRPDEVAHVQAPAYLADGVARAVTVRSGSGGLTHLRGRVDPARLARTVPRAHRASILAAVRNDYASGSFPADFWLDSKGRVRRVRASYHTSRGGSITVDARYSAFGAPVDVTVPAPQDVQDISP
jgi:hypothetical protein